jgi:hypothetical protein
MNRVKDSESNRDKDIEKKLIKRDKDSERELMNRDQGQ